MAFKRKMTSRRPYAKRRRIARRRVRYSRVARPLKSQQLTFKRKFWFQTWVPSPTSTDGFWRYWNVNLAQLQDHIRLAELFDMYRIRGVLFELIPRYTEFAGNDQTSGTVNRSGTKVHVINDPYSTVAPSGVYGTSTANAFLENGNCKTYTGTRPIRIFTRPAVNIDVTDMTMIKKAPWIRTDFPNKGHKCCHVFMQDTNFVGVFQQTFDVWCTFYLQFKNLK